MKETNSFGNSFGIRAVERRNRSEHQQHNWH